MDECPRLSSETDWTSFGVLLELQKQSLEMNVLPNKIVHLIDASVNSVVMGQLKDFPKTCPRNTEPFPVAISKEEKL